LSKNFFSDQVDQFGKQSSTSLDDRLSKIEARYLFRYFLLFVYFNLGVAEKHDFCGIQRKIPQNPDFAQKQDLNPVPHG
jgi:hypothetical protein